MSSSKGTVTYASELSKAVTSGWVMVSEGPSGAQLRKPKRMRGSDKFCLFAGMVCLFFVWPVGVLLVLVAAIDYVFLTKERTVFLSRDNPEAIK